MTTSASTTAADLIDTTGPVLPLVIAGRPHAGDDVARLDSPGRPGHVRTFATASPNLVDEAAQAAFNALPATRALTRLQRSQILRETAVLLEQDRADLGLSICWEVGKSLRDSLGEVDRCAATLRAAADAVVNLVGSEEPLDAVPVGAGRLGFTIWEPIGVVAAICGFNFPLLLAVHKVASAIGAGCPVLVKPSDRTPFTTVALAGAVIEAGWPAEAISVLNGGPDTGDALVTHRHVRLVSFTGSSTIGAKIAESAARGLKRCVLELGSNAATIVAADADVARAAAVCAIGTTSGSGQSCISVQRILVHDSIADDFVAQLVKAVEALRRGAPDDPATAVGSVVSVRERDRILGIVEDAVRNGATLSTGGLVDEWGLQPTIVDAPAPRARIGHEEVFGPVAAIYRFTDLDDAITVANAVPYGLMAGVFTESISTAIEVAKRLDVGGVHINDSSNFRPDNMPYGGVKLSGYGKEGPAHAMREMSNQKVITLCIGGTP